MGVTWADGTGRVLLPAKFNGWWQGDVFYLQCLSGVLGTYWWAMVSKRNFCIINDYLLAVRVEVGENQKKTPDMYYSAVFEQRFML